MSKAPRVSLELTYQKLVEVLSQQGPKKASELIEILKISQPTFSRVVAAHSHVLKIEQGREVFYALHRMGSWGVLEIPVFLVDAAANLKQVATLHPLRPQGFYFESKVSGFSSRIYPDLPYFLEDSRPSGFLGRLVPKLYPQLKLPSDLNSWTDDHTLAYLISEGWDLIGNLMLGEKAYDQYLKARLEGLDLISELKRAEHYPRVAQLVLSTGVPGSSAAGEQPKFLSIVETSTSKRHVLVKFSPPMTDALSIRVADLLVSENLAHEILKTHGQQAPKSELLSSEDRLFLEIERFDRNQIGGRYGVISLSALNLEFVGHADESWSETARVLLEQRKIDQPTYEKVLWLDVFGKLIANTDRHFGNISFFCEGEQIKGLTPAYDMLPMLYVPFQNQLIEREFKPLPPKHFELPVWHSALAAAKEFWSEVKKHPQISQAFKIITSQNETKLFELEKLVGILPQPR